ncbi:hypothetical protein BDS110ZK25_20780 [Bradyrhizobium diazoefficiens]
MCMAWQAMPRLCYRDPKTCLPSSLATRCAREGEIGNEYRGMKFSCGADLLRVLEDCPALEFYVCDEKASYLLCSNHHDFVVGWGAALPWVARC